GLLGGHAFRGLPARRDRHARPAVLPLGDRLLAVRHRRGAEEPMKKHETLIYSAVGLAALFLILVAFNYLASLGAGRVDLTEGNIYTLSDGTKKILRGLDSPVKLKLYITRGEQGMPVQLRSFAQRVEDLAREFKSIAGSNLVIELYDPKPDSEAEEAAQL